MNRKRVGLCSIALISIASAGGAQQTLRPVTPPPPPKSVFGPIHLNPQPEPPGVTSDINRSITVRSPNAITGLRNVDGRTLPSPLLRFSGKESYTGSDGSSYVRYNYRVPNYSSYPSQLFSPAEALPPCGANTHSSRTWVDLYSSQGKRLYGFCALKAPADLNTIWFSLGRGVMPPIEVYIEMSDRQTNTKYKSNLAATGP